MAEWGITCWLMEHNDCSHLRLHHLGLFRKAALDQRRDVGERACALVSHLHHGSHGARLDLRHCQRDAADQELHMSGDQGNGPFADWLAKPRMPALATGLVA